MSRASEYANSVSSLYAQIGEARAREAANKGQIWSGVLANIGDFVAQYPERKAKMEEIKNRAAMTDLEKQRLQHQIDQEKRDEDEDQKIRDLFSQAQNEWQASQGGIQPSSTGAVNPNGLPTYFPNPNQPGPLGAPTGTPAPQPPTSARQSPIPTPSEILRTVSPKKAIALINGLAALKQDPQDDPEKEAAALRQVALGLNALPEDMRAQAYPGIVQHYPPAKRLVDKGRLSPTYEGPDYWKFIMGTGQEPSKPSTSQPTEASLAADLSSPDPVVRERAKVALDRLKPIKAEGDSITGPEADERYRKIIARPPKARGAEDAAWAAAYERQKTLGPMAMPVIVQTAQGPQAMDRRALTTQPITSASTGEAVVAPASETQAKDAGFAKRLQDTEAVLAKIGPDISKMPYLEFKLQEKLPAAGQSAKFQPYDQASRNLINAILRRESGAAISQSEFDNARAQYLPQPGDTPQMLAQKATNRRRQLETVAVGAGTALKPDVEKVRVKGPNGESGTVPKGTALPPGWSFR